MARDLVNGLLNMNIGQVSEKKRGIVYLDIDKVLPSDDNFYHINDDDIQMMAYAIEAVGQVEQPLLVKKIADSDKYELIAGHKRRAGANYLVEQGKEEYRNLPCIVKDESIENELSLILTNSTQRELTSFEKMKQVEILRNYIEKYEIKGNKREIISNLINLSKSEVGRLENISKNLTEPLKEEFEAGTIATGTANMIASMPAEKQEQVHEIIKENGTVKMGEVKAIKDSAEEKEEDKPIEGQMQVEDYPELLTDDMKNEIREENRKKLIVLFFENLESIKKQVIDICRQNTSNKDRAKKMQKVLAPSGFNMAGSAYLDYSFYSFDRGVEMKSHLENIQWETYTYGQFLEYFKEIYSEEIENKPTSNFEYITDEKFEEVLEALWSIANEDYNNAKKSIMATNALLEFRIWKEAMDMYRSNYKSRKGGGIMIHNFDANIAAEYGILEAILLNNIYYWVEKNKANDKNFYDGTYWTYNSTKAFSSLFPYASERQIKAALKKLRDADVLKTGNYNENTYDRTLWYSLTEKGFSIVQNGTMHSTKSYNAEDKAEQSNEQNGTMESTETSNPSDADVRPIPNNKPYSKPDVNNQSVNQSGDGQDRQEKKIDVYENLIKTNIAYDDLITSYPYEQRLIDEIVNIMLDAVLSKGDYVRIKGEEKPRALISSVLLKLRYENIEYVLEKYKQQVERIKNKQAYLLAMLYNSASETDAHYTNEVRADYWEG